MLSYWERESFLKYDFIIIGSGIVGLSTAASIIERQPDARVLVLERGILPSGASTRNAGFACFGSLTELIADRKLADADELLDLVRMRWEGLGMLRYRLGDTAIRYENHGGYELLFGQQADAMKQMDEVNDWLYPLFQKPVFQERNDLIQSFGFNADKVAGLVENPFEGQIHTGEMMQSLIRYVTGKGVSIITGAEVQHIEEDGEGASVWVNHPVLGEKIVFSASQLAVCTNAFSKSLLPELEVKPGRGQVLVTKPIPDLPFKGVFHYDEGFFYFRNEGERVLFGGGRNLDFEGETTEQFGFSEKIQNTLQEHLDTIILPGRSYEIDMRWSGIMAFGPERKPILKRKSPRIAIGVRMNGMGVAIGSMIGDRLAKVMLEG